MKKWGVLLLIMFLLACLLFFLSINLYFYHGLQNYIRDISMVQSFPDAQLKAQAINDFYGASGEYKGVLAGVDSLNGGGVWVWRNYLPERFPVDQYTVYSLFNGCANLSPAPVKSGETKQINQYNTQNVREWLAKVKPGQFVELIFTQAGQGTTVGVVREVRVYSWQVFLPISLEDQCAN